MVKKQQYYQPSAQYSKTLGLLSGRGGGVPLIQIMESEVEFLTARRGLGGYFSEEFVKYYS